MDILLAHAYYLNEDAHERAIMKPYPPLGILYISAYLKAQGFAVGVFDATFRAPSEFAALVQAERPPVVGLYVNLMTKFNALAMIAVARAAGATVILGGPEPPHYAEAYLSHGADAVVVGEGEATLAELLPRLARHGHAGFAGVAGLIYRDAHGTPVRNPPRAFLPDLDALPAPDRAAINLPQYVETWRAHHGMGAVSLICARGCPYHCTWCSHSVFGETHRRRSPERVADEVTHLREAYAPDMLWYADDVFTIHTRWSLRYAAELQRRGIRIPFECISRADRLSAPVVAALAQMGCFRVWIGAESGSQRLLDAMRRDVTTAEVQAAARLARQHGIQVGMFIMLGFEGEEQSDLDETVAHLKRSAPDVFLTTVAYPIKGTAFYAQVAERVRAPGGSPDPVRDAWESWSDRDLTVRGRHSRRYYSFATRWMVGAVALHRHTRGRIQPLKAARAAANAALGRAGMWATRRERDGAP